MLAERFVVIQPCSSRELAICANDKQLVRSQISPAMWEVTGQYERINAESFNPANQIRNLPLFTRRGAVNAKRPLKKQLRLMIVWPGVVVGQKISQV